MTSPGEVEDAEISELVEAIQSDYEVVVVTRAESHSLHRQLLEGISQRGVSSIVAVDINSRGEEKRILIPSGVAATSLCSSLAEMRSVEPDASINFLYPLCINRYGLAEQFCFLLINQ